jgi:hypothetical protein
MEKSAGLNKFELSAGSRLDSGPQWRRVRGFTNLSYPQVPGSIPAENPSTQINMDLSK